MKSIRSFLFIAISFAAISAADPRHSEKTIVLTWAFGAEKHWGDTAVVYYGYKGHVNDVNDSIQRATGSKYSDYTTMIICQPSWVLDSINFHPFINLRTLVLMGNDDDVIDSVRYEFFSLPKLKRIVASNLFLNTASEEYGYMWKGKSRFKSYVKGFRPDIRVKFNYNYTSKLWGNED